MSTTAVQQITRVVYSRHGQERTEERAVMDRDSLRDAQYAPEWADALHYYDVVVVTDTDDDSAVIGQPTNLSKMCYINGGIFTQQQLEWHEGEKAQAALAQMVENNWEKMVRTRFGDLFPYIRGEHAIVLIDL